MRYINESTVDEGDSENDDGDDDGRVDEGIVMMVNKGGDDSHNDAGWCGNGYGGDDIHVYKGCWLWWRYNILRFHRDHYLCEILESFISSSQST